MLEKLFWGDQLINLQGKAKCFRQDLEQNTLWSRQGKIRSRINRETIFSENCCDLKSCMNWRLELGAGK